MMNINRPRFPLKLPLLLQRLPDLRRHGDNSDPSLCLGCADLESTTPSRLLLAVKQAVVDGDGFPRKVAVLPPQADDLPHAAACPKHHGKQRLPLPIPGRASDKLHECGLLCLCQCLFLGVLPSAALLDVGQGTVGGICTDQVVPNRQRENRVQ